MLLKCFKNLKVMIILFSLIYLILICYCLILINNVKIIDLNCVVLNIFSNKNDFWLLGRYLKNLIDIYIYMYRYIKFRVVMFYIEIY